MTSRVIIYTDAMSRWQPDARERLERAAIELFIEQGFAATTVPEITARAGLTTRTFFRHFADKREVLFAGAENPEFATRLIADAPASLDPMTLILESLRTVAETRFEGRRPELRRLREIIRSDEGLRERNLRKRAALSEAVHDGFLARGVAKPAAELLAETSVTLFYISVDAWLDQDAAPDGDQDAEQDGGRKLFEFVLDTLESLRSVLASGPTAQRQGPTPGPSSSGPPASPPVSGRA